MNGDKKPVRIWVDGCFDLFHFGHCNAIRQAKAFGDELVVGIHSDEEIKKQKVNQICHFLFQLFRLSHQLTKTETETYMRKKLR